MKGCLMGRGEVTVVEAWQEQRGRRQHLKGALRSDLEHTSPVTHLFMTNLLSELHLLHRRNHLPLLSKPKILVKTCEQRGHTHTHRPKTHQRPLNF